MLVSRHWLSKFFADALPNAETLAEALTFHAFEIDNIQNVGEDTVLDVKVTPNRGHDCLSHRGIAKELSAILELPLASDPLAQKPVLEPVTDRISIVLEDATQSPRFIAAYIQNVKTGPSPEWLRKNLEAIGQRSVNNIVDATNFVMFNTGQPVHAFDAGKLMQKEGKFAFVVRKARQGESITTLDNKTYPLAERMLVVADGNADAPVGIAGVKGGLPAGISEATTNIIIETANFSGVSVRRTAAALKLRTDASSRFEQVISPELAGYGMRAVTDLILKLAGGELVGFADVYPEPQKEWQVSVRAHLVNKILGTDLDDAHFEKAFQRLGFPFRVENEVFTVTPPFERLDLTTPEDLVEEVGRLIGYDKVPATPLSKFPRAPEINPTFVAAEKKREELVAQGYSEVYTSVFRESGERAVLNKVDSVKPYLRSSLIPGLEDALEKNKHNKELLGLKEIKLFEIGTVWVGGKEKTMLGTITEHKKASEQELERVAAETYDDLPLSTAARYKPYSKYPYIVRDIALWTPAGTSEEELREQIQSEAGPLAESTALFDKFEKGGKTSLAYRIIFQSFERTLTEGEANEAIQKVAEALKSKGFEIR